MKIAVASGKGGTGKTTISTLLAYAGEDTQYVDCDVEEPNGRIFLKPDIEETLEYTELVPKINEDICTFCGKCSDACVYRALVVVGAIKKTMFFGELCHSCGVCKYVCPVENALIEVPKVKGKINIGKAGRIDFLEGVLNIGEASAVPLIRGLKKYISDEKTAILDSPPGTSCPVVETVEDADFIVLVTEPTPFGLNDLKLAVELTRDLKKPFGIIINKYDKNLHLINDYAERENIDILYRLKFSREFAKVYSNGTLPFDSFESDFKNILYKIKSQL